MQEKEHVIQVLQKALVAADQGNVIELKNLSNQTIHKASIYEDNDNIIIAVLIYALSKFIERRGNYNEKEYIDFITYYHRIINDSIDYIKKNDFVKFRENIQNMIKKANKFSEQMKLSLSNMFEKAKINKASKIYEHGLSMEKTAKLLGVSMWELAEYTGQAGALDYSPIKTVDLKKRLKNAMEIFQ